MRIDQPTRDLLRAIVREAGTNDRLALGELVRAIIDWDALFSVAREHRLLPLLFHRLNSAEVPLPPAAELRLRAEYERNIFHSLANAAELIALVQAFNKQNIVAIPFKGLVLASSAYRNPALRSVGDIDFLIFERDLSRATTYLRSRGYELTTEVLKDGSPANPNYYEFHFERGTDGMVVELRWKLELIDSRLGSRFERNLGMDWVWPRRRTVNISGVEVPNLDPTSTLLILCMHGAKHLWSRLAWVYDVAQTLEANPDLNWGEVEREAERRGLWRALALGVLLAQRICCAPVPEIALRGFASDRAARQMTACFERMIFDRPGQLPLGPVPYALRILDTADRIRWLLKLEFLRPNERDIAFVRFPSMLYPLYFFVRPLRILLDRSAR